MEENKFNTRYTNNVVCPHCGYENKDSWELYGDDGEENETSCHKCDEPFTYCRNIEVTYTSQKIKK